MLNIFKCENVYLPKKKDQPSHPIILNFLKIMSHFRTKSRCTILSTSK